MTGGAARNGMPALAATARVPDHVVYREFAHETVVLNLKTGRYHGLNPSGGRMLEALERTGTIEEALGRLAAEYGRSRDELEGDLRVFCADLLARGLIEVSSNGRH